MRRRIPNAAKIVLALTAAGFLLSGCHGYRAYHGGPHVAPPGHSYKHHYHGKDRKHGDRYRYYRHGDRRWR